MDDDPVLVGPVELLIQQAEELFIARTSSHGIGPLAKRVSGRLWIGIAWEVCPPSIAGFEAPTNTHLGGIVQGSGGRRRRKAESGGQRGADDRFFRGCRARPGPLGPSGG